MSEKVALVIGASGMVGGNLASHIAGLSGWRAFGVSRKPPAGPKRFEHISFDLLNVDQCHAALANHPEITHVFVAARTQGATSEQEERNNIVLLANLVDTLEKTAPKLRHIHVVHGTKWYGAHLPNTSPPFREDDARVMPPNPYYGQHDFLLERQKGRHWTWSTSRPGLVFGYATGYPHNIVCLIGILAAMSRELGTQFRFPGTEWCFRSLQSATDIGLLCRAIVSISESEHGANTSFNVGNGDVYSWSNLWPRIAKSFDLECGYPQKYVLADYMADKEPVWQRIVEKYGLRDFALKDLVAWPYGDFHFNKEGSDIASLVKINGIGFHEVSDSEDLFMRVLQQYREEGVLPR